MRLGHFDLNLLLALEALLETRSVTLASERLHIGVSATSSALGRLREHFNDQLLQQVGRRMELTPLAHQLVEPVRDVLVRTRATLQSTADFEPETSGRCFVFNASDYIGTVFMTRLARHLQSCAPRVRLQLISLSSQVLEQLDRGGVDFAIYPDVNASTEHPSEKLFEDSFSCVLWRGNTLAADSLTLEQYQSLRHVTVRLGPHHLASFEERALQDMGIRREVAMVANSFNTQAQLVVGTPWASTMHTRLAHWYAGFLPLRVLPLPIRMPPLRMVMQWHRFQNKAPAHVWMRAQMRQVAAGLDSEIAG